MTNFSKKPAYPLLTLLGQGYWCKVIEPNQDNKFSLDLTVSPQDKEMLAKYNITTKNKGDDRGDFVSLWTYAFSKDGEPNTLSIYDNKAQKWNGALIGNGSIVKVECRPKEWEYRGKTGNRLSLLGLQVIKHVMFEKAGASFTPVEDVDTSDMETNQFTVASVG